MEESPGARFGRMLAAKAAYEDGGGGGGGGGGDGQMGFEAFSLKGAFGQSFEEFFDKIGKSDIGKIFSLGITTINSGIFEQLNFLGQGTFDGLKLPKLDTLKLPKPTLFSKGRGG